jgi:hypothetical protein
MTCLGRNVVAAFVATFFLSYVGFLSSWLHTGLTVALLLTFAVKLAPPWPDKYMDPISAILINKKKLPAGLPTHLTFAFYFDKCPQVTEVTKAMEGLKSCDRFTSIPVSSYGSIFESSWRKVELDMSQHIHDMEVIGDTELEEEIQAMTLGKSRPLVEGKPGWRIDLLRNKNGKSAMVWRLEHYIGDGIGLMPVMAPLFRNKDGSPYAPPSWVGARGGVKKGNQKGVLDYLKLVPRVLMDAFEVLTLPAGPFDTVCAFNRNAETKELLYDGCRQVASVDFSLDDIMELKKKATQAEEKKGGETSGAFTVNDILCALWAGCLRRYLQKVGDPLVADGSDGKMIVRGQAPFALPRSLPAGQVSNNMCFVCFKIPVGEATWQQRLTASKREFRQLKNSAKVPIPCRSLSPVHSSSPSSHSPFPIHSSPHSFSPSFTFSLHISLSPRYPSLRWSPMQA